MLYSDILKESSIPQIYREGEQYHEVFKNIISDIDVNLLASILSAVYETWNCGEVSEVATSAYFRDKGYSVLRNLYLPYNNLFTEVDMLCYNKKHILIIENKRLMNANKIKQSEYNWYIDTGIDVYSMFSPVKQQNRHAEALSKIVGSSAKDFKYHITVWKRGKLFKYPISIDEFENLEEKYKVFESRDEMLKTLAMFCSNSDLMKAIHIYKLKVDNKKREAG